MTSPKQVQLAERLAPETLEQIADFLIGWGDDFPINRRAEDLNLFFERLGIQSDAERGDRKPWLVEFLEDLQPLEVEKVVIKLADLRTYRGRAEDLESATTFLNSALKAEGFEISFLDGRPKLIERTLTDLNGFGESEKDRFLRRKIDVDLAVKDLAIESALAAVIQQRVDEAETASEQKLPLATIFLLGSALEGLLLAYQQKDKEGFGRTKVGTKQKKEWTLDPLIEASAELNILGNDVREFGFALRNFRNYIHPRKQLKEDFTPTEDTADLCSQVFRVAFSQLKRYDSAETKVPYDCS